MGENATNCTNRNQVPFYEYALVYNECILIDQTDPFPLLYSQKLHCIDNGMNTTNYYDTHCASLNSSWSINWGCDVTGGFQSYFEVVQGQCPVNFDYEYGDNGDHI